MNARVHLAGIIFGILLLAPASGQDTPEAASARSTAVGVRQEHVQRMMQDLEQKFVDLARTLEKTEPGQAKRLIEALQRSKEAGVENRMGEIARLLNESDFSTATDGQKQVVVELQKLIAILLEEDDALQDELDRLERWKEQIEELIKEETDHRRESEKVSDKDKTLSDLAEQIAALENLIKKQEQVIERTIQTRKQGIQGLGKVADQQRRVRAETEALSKKIGAPRAGSDQGGNQAQPESSPAGQDGDEKAPPPSDEKPGSPQEPKESGQPDGKPASESGDPGGKPSEGQGSSGNQGSPQGSKPANAGKEPGQESLEKASEHQKAAENDLNAGRGKGAEDNEKKALDQLQKALAQLKGEQRRIASLPPEAFDSMAQKQDDTAGKTAGLGDEMKKSPAPSSSSGAGGSKGQAGEGSSSESQPGQKQVQQAQQSMQQASGGLRKKDPKAAAKEQKKAIDDLKKALDEIEERLAQLRRDMQIEKLAALEARFREMLNRQEPVTAGTHALEELRIQKKFTRADRLKLSKFGDEERAIGDLAQKALDIIIEDGTSVVFPHVVEQLREDLLGVGELLKNQRTDSYTQGQQQEIEATLKELIDALQKLQKQISEGGGGTSTGEQNEPLLPNSAELKLLKASQLRVNRRTKSFEEVRPAGQLEQIMRDEIAKIAQRQLEIAELTQEMVDRN